MTPITIALPLNACLKKMADARTLRVVKNSVFPDKPAVIVTIYCAIIARTFLKNTPEKFNILIPNDFA